MEKFMRYISNSENETIEIAKKIASNLKSDDIIVLTGDLGSGKTKFTEGILDYFGFKDEISSPTFTIVNEYKNEKVKIFHFDVYRLADLDEFYAIGGDEYFGKGICIIEWGEQVEEALPKRYLKIAFSKDDENENKRVLSIEKIDKNKKREE